MLIFMFLGRKNFHPVVDINFPIASSSRNFSTWKVSLISKISLSLNGLFKWQNKTYLLISNTQLPKVIWKKKICYLWIELLSFESKNISHPFFVNWLEVQAKATFFFFMWAINKHTLKQSKERSFWKNCEMKKQTKICLQKYFSIITFIFFRKLCKQNKQILIFPRDFCRSIYFSVYRNKKSRN